jgi:hypothetical protein
MPISIAMAEVRRQGAEFVGDRVPRIGEEKAEAEMSERRQGAMHQRDHHAAEDDEDEDREEGRDAAKEGIADLAVRASG